MIWMKRGDRNRLGRFMLGPLCLLAFTGCATTEHGWLPLRLISVSRISQLDKARDDLQTYQRMGAELERRKWYADAAIAYTNAAVIALVLRNLQYAMDASQKAVEMAEYAGKPSLLAAALDRLGYTHIFLNAPDRAISVFEREAQSWKMSHNPLGEAESYRGLSRAYRNLGKPELALENARRGVEMLRAIELQESAKPPLYRASVEYSYARTLVELGQIHLNLRQSNPAREAFQEALGIAKRIRAEHSIAQAEQGLGRVAADQGAFDAAVGHFKEALRLSTRPGFVANTQVRLGRVYREMGKLPEAEDALRIAVATIEDLRSLLQSEELREMFVEDKTRAYADLLHVLFDQRKEDEAFNISERARARAFLDLLGNRVSLSKGRTAALIAEEKALQERIAQLKAREILRDSEEDGPEESARRSQRGLQRELDLAREAYGAFLSRVRAQSREQASLMTVEPLTLAEVQRLLGPETVLLEYFVGGGRTLVWVVSRNALRAFRLRIGETELTRRVSQFRNLIASRGRLEELRGAAHDLYEMLLAPAFPAGLPRELIIVPHRVLHYLPFHTLMPTPGRYLLQDSLVYYLSSASLMQFTREKAQATGAAALAVGNPDLEDPTLNLRYAEREAKEVGRQFPGAVVLIRQEATKPRMRAQMGPQSLIHLATHADLDEDDPLGSALLLRPEGSDSGRLEVQEIFGLDLKASLVILSACDTSLGKLTEGDEVIGLTRAFIYAGTPSVISTLWRVDDRASYELMRAFYENLKAGQPKGEALRQAQLATLQKHPHPYYWAAYELTGEAR